MTLGMPRFIFVIFLAGIFTLLISFRTLDLFGIAPNLFLIFGLFLLYAPTERRADAWSTFTLALITFLSLSFIHMGFWTHYVILLAMVMLITYALRMFLTGYIFIDYLISISLGTIFFNIASSALFGGGPILQTIFLVEVIYNLALGALLWAILRGLKIL